MRIPRDYNVVDRDVIDPAKGTAYDANPGITPSIKAVSDTPGEKATNETSMMETNKGQPFGKGGSGYTGG